MARDDTKRLSRNPAAIRARMRRNRDCLSEDFEMYINVASTRYKPVEEWDYEELRRGKPRNIDGSFVGRKPVWVTPLIKQEIARRLRSHVMDEIAEHAQDAVLLLVDFLTNEDVKDELRLKAATLILEYVAGKPEQKVQLEGNLRMNAVLAGALMLDDGQTAHPVLEGTVIEKDDLGVGNDAERE